ncbi:GNAT family N-acetyltransferase [Streptomyces tanashiensis]|uniref:GNAT family N-acetyltransferase n=1 Tax=Streptomyces tanashiensis TaxID=67367 RepID=UPI003402F6BA
MTRMPLPDAPKTATIDDARTVGHTPASAFGDDPMTRWFFPDGASRETGLGRHFTTLITRQYGLHGVCKQTESAAAFWVSPEGADKAVPGAKTTQGLVEILGDRAPAFQEAVMAAAEHGPAEPHWYLAAIGADPAARGQGHGSALLRSGLAKADAAGLPVHLESSKPDNPPVYEHFGFVIRDEFSLPGGGPVLWSMKREPRA